MAGLIKTILMMQNRAIPKQVKHISAHPKIAPISEQMAIPTETISWNAKTLIACVNNYGAAGSIAVIFVKEPPSNKRLRHTHNLPVIKVQRLNKLPFNHHCQQD